PIFAVLPPALLPRRGPSMHWRGQPSKLIRPFRVWLVTLVLLIGGAGCPRPHNCMYRWVACIVPSDAAPLAAHRCTEAALCGVPAGAKKPQPIDSCGAR